MPCPLCGDICRCSPGAYSTASPRWLPDSGACAADASMHRAQLETPVAAELSLRPAAGASIPSESTEPTPNESAPEDAPAWRQEVAARLSRYQARRKPRPPRYPSLRLRFEAEDPPRTSSGACVESAAFSQKMATTSNQALALDGFVTSAVHAVEVPVPEPLMPEAGQQESVPFFLAPDPLQHPTPTTAPGTPAVTAPAPATAKIIEFPRSWTPAPAPLDELAEPVIDIDRPRILEAPEFVPPPPALGGITIEPAPQPELEKRPGIDFPLQSAPLARRIFCTAIDGLIIAAACALFGFIFWKMTAIRPPRLQLVGLAAGLSGVFWAAYQYLLVVYSGSTPGLRLARLELARFDGSRASRRLRRWRVLASFLSAASLGMGYAWVFLDEDSLCWHDRITHTYLAPTQVASTSWPS